MPPQLLLLKTTTLRQWWPSTHSYPGSWSWDISTLNTNGPISHLGTTGTTLLYNESSLTFSMSHTRTWALGLALTCFFPQLLMGQLLLVEKVWFILWFLPSSNVLCILSTNLQICKSLGHRSRINYWWLRGKIHEMRCLHSMHLGVLLTDRPLEIGSVSNV